MKARCFYDHGSYSRLAAEAETDTVLDADFLRENFIPDGCEIESVTVQMGDVTLTDAYDPAKQELHLQNVTENVNVMFVFKGK